MTDLALFIGCGGLGAGFGAESKIKAGVTPWQLARCLHIIFGGVPGRCGTAPFLPQCPATIEFSGGAPFRNPNGCRDRG